MQQGLVPHLDLQWQARADRTFSSNVWVLVTVRLSKQTQPQGSIEIVHTSDIIDAHATTNNIFHIQILVFSTRST